MGKQIKKSKPKTTGDRAKAVSFLELDHNSVTPHYQQLEEQLLDAIRNQHLRPGDPLPSERELAGALGISRMTVRRSLTNLEMMDVLESQVGKGWYVSSSKIEQTLSDVLGVSRRTVRRALTGIEERGVHQDHVGDIDWYVSSSHFGPPAGEEVRGFSADMSAAGLSVSSEVIQFENTEATNKLTKLIGDDVVGEHVYYLERLRRVDGKLVGLEQSYIPERICPGLERYDFSKQSLYAVMREEYGLKLAWAAQEVEASSPSKREASLLKIGQKAAVIRSARTVYDAENVPLEISKATYRSDRYKYQIRVEGGNSMAVMR